jgi:hypothetical protein
VLQDKTPIAMAVILVGRLDPAAGSKLALVAKYGANQ